jgi:predicted DCC family thiol-disulfide oxidoreductase YuxK
LSGPDEASALVVPTQGRSHASQGVVSAGVYVKEHDRIEVFYDATCPLCRAWRRWAEGRDRDGRLAFRDLEDPAAAACIPAASEEPRGAMWVRLAGGERASGFAGWLVVLRALPRWRCLACVLGLPPVQLVGRGVYRIVANHRHALVSR